MNLVFATLQADLGMGAAFRLEFPADQPEKLGVAKRSWLRPELAEIPEAMFQLALRRIGTEWQAGKSFKSLPSLGDFLLLAQPSAETMGVPDEAAAWREAVAASAEPAVWRWSCDAVRVAAVAVGFFDLRHGDADALRRRFAQAYSQCLRKLARGEPLEVVQGVEWDGGLPLVVAADRAAEQALQARMHAQGVPASADACRAQLRALLGCRRHA